MVEIVKHDQTKVEVVEVTLE
ncbi:hypothetical protein [Peribacillus loiseleuriae]|nr:hypothetical protein [Peribacillus loiseleuriae]